MAMITVPTPPMSELKLKNDDSDIVLHVAISHPAPLKTGRYTFMPRGKKPPTEGEIDFSENGTKLGTDKELGNGLLEVRVDIPATTLSKKFAVTVDIAGGETFVPMTAEGTAPAVGDILRYNFFARFVKPVVRKKKPQTT